jgi:hypothetical protein
MSDEHEAQKNEDRRPETLPKRAEENRHAERGRGPTTAVPEKKQEAHPCSRQDIPEEPQKPSGSHPGYPAR